MLKPTSRRRFTLIEMLIVITIIAILAALLSPSLQKAIQQAQGIACANNMRNVHLAFTAYAQDNHDRYPPLSVRRADNSWASWWHQDVAGRYFDANITWRNSNGHDLQQIRCPGASYLGIGYNNSDYPYPEFNTNILNYYAAAGGLIYTGKKTWKPITRGRNLSRLVILVDSLDQNGNPSDSFGNLNDRVAYRHAGHANGAFADGHVRVSDNFLAEYLDKRVAVKIE